MTEIVTYRTLYLVFRGYCLHCGRATERAHQDSDCDMNGAEERAPLVLMAMDEWAKGMIVDRLAKAAREYLEWADDDNRDELQDVLQIVRQRR